MDPVYRKFIDWLNGKAPLPARGESAKARAPEGRELREFLEQLLTHPRKADGIRELVETGLAKSTMPELEDLHGVEQPEEFHPEGDCFVHTVLTLEHLKDDASFELSLAALLHDIGKPATFRKTDRIRFYGHETKSAKMAEEIMKRMELDDERIEYVSRLIALHMQVKDVTRMSEKTLVKFVRTPWFEDLVELTRADCMASHGDLSIVEYALEKSVEIGPEPPPPPPPLITGQDLIMLGLEPGPRFSTILDKIKKLRDRGVISTREEALEQVKKDLQIGE